MNAGAPDFQRNSYFNHISLTYVKFSSYRARRSILTKLQNPELDDSQREKLAPQPSLPQSASGALPHNDDRDSWDSVWRYQAMADKIHSKIKTIKLAGSAPASTLVIYWLVVSVVFSKGWQDFVFFPIFPSLRWSPKSNTTQYHKWAAEIEARRRWALSSWSWMRLGHWTQKSNPFEHP